MTIITYYNYDYVLMAIITQPINDSNYVLITTYYVHSCQVHNRFSYIARMF